uniref:histone deacetylase 6-like n=1 Tax=Pristiophorus japonicus TaxID=55135 RepID=UPI00398E817E
NSKKTMRKTDNRTDGKSQAQIQPVNTADTISTQLSDLHLDKDPILSVTALIHHVRLTEPICLWDSSSPENAESVTAVMAKIEEYGLMQRCKLLEGRLATNEELLMVHSPEYIDRIKSTEKMTTEELHTLSDSYDLVYFHPKSYTACCLAVGCILQLVDEIMGSKVRNGMAVVRPPGHNAHRDSASAYCIFNNLAIAAGYSIKKHGVER